MNWLDELMDDIAVEVALEEIALAVNYETKIGNYAEVQRLAMSAERVRKSRSPEMLARIARDAEINKMAKG